jgi:hypothetical protein
MKISRFIVMAVFGLGLISQNSFSYVNVDQNNKIDHKRMKHHDKIACEKSAFPLFNKEENRPCKDAKPEKKHAVKHVRKHDMCGQGCHRSAFPLFNKEENRTCVCPDADKNMTPKMNNGMTKTVAKK